MRTLHEQKNKIKKEAVVAQSLYLVNLLLLPLIAFILLVIKYRGRTPVKGIHYLHQVRSIQLSIIAGILLIVIPGLTIWLMTNIEVSIMIFILYFIILHVFFVLIGMVNLSRAISGRAPIF